MADFVSKLLSKSIRNIWKASRKAARKSGMDYSLLDSLGRRKYLVPAERKRFLQAALDVGGPTASFCAVIALTGMRITEALELTPNRIDEATCCISVETLKQRRRGIFRSVPIPRELILYLDGVHDLSTARGDPTRADAPIWPWSRTTGWRRIQAVMRRAAAPSYASHARALRHAFGVEASMEGVILTMVQKWLGHSDIRTTTVYTTVVGREEQALAGRTWQNLIDELRDR